MDSISGAQFIASNLQSLGVDVVFGIVGIPVIEVAQACIDIGIRFIGFRNEQSASYAAAAYGYLNGQPGVILAVGGPGVIHAMAGVHHAAANGWPVLLVAGSSESYQKDMGAFQELDQVGFLKPQVKFASQAASLAQLPFVLEKAYRTAYTGRPGPTYVDLPADQIQGTMKPDKELYCRPSAAPVRTLAPASEIVRAVTLLRSAKKPLIIIGKGAQYSRAEDPLSLLLERLPVPFLPTPMGKGLVTDAHPLCIAAARSPALAEADVVMVIGARLNWILHYGKSPKWRKDVKLIRIDISSETIDDNSRADVPLVGDAYAILTQMCEEVIRAGGNQELTMSKDQTAWYKLLMAKCHDNSQKLIEKTMLFPTRKASAAVPPLLTYQQAFDIIRKSIPKDHIFIGEGANTMDIARSMFEVQQPRSRLDAGTQATMGVGLGYCIAAAIYEQKKPADRRPVVAVLGDSAFGFSAMEIETAVRNKLGMLIIVMNNGGVYKGLPSEVYDTIPVQKLPPTALLPDLHYEQLSIALGGQGRHVRTPRELREAVSEGIRAQNDGVLTLVNVMMDSGSTKKLEFGWLASTKAKL